MVKELACYNSSNDRIVGCCSAINMCLSQMDMCIGKSRYGVLSFAINDLIELFL